MSIIRIIHIRNNSFSYIKTHVFSKKFQLKDFSDFEEHILVENSQEVDF